MRFLIFNLLLICLLLFGISYLAFSHTGTVTDAEPRISPSSHHHIDGTPTDATLDTLHTSENL